MSTGSNSGQGALLFRPGPLTVAEFIGRWQQSTQSERASAQSHFQALCTLLEQPDPSSDPSSDPDSADYAFEKIVTKTGCGAGYADMWKRSHFAWEYKGKHKNLVDAYRQLLDCREALDNYCCYAGFRAGTETGTEVPVCKACG